MAGGTTSIILRNFAKQDFIWLDNFIRERSIAHAFSEKLWDIHTDFEVIKQSKNKSKNVTKNRDLRPFIVVFHEKKTEFDDEPHNQMLLKKLGYNSVCSIDVAAMCSDKIDHSVQANLSIAIAKHYDGLISLNGLLTPSGIKNPSFEEAKTFAQSVEGTVYFAEYTLESGEKWANQFVDAVYLSNWMRHEEFRMLK
jgi:Family of unknown function (DUF6368)